MKYYDEEEYSPNFASALISFFICILGFCYLFSFGIFEDINKVNESKKIECSDKVGNEENQTNIADLNIKMGSSEENHYCTLISKGDNYLFYTYNKDVQKFYGDNLDKTTYKITNSYQDFITYYIEYEKIN